MNTGHVRVYTVEFPNWQRPIVGAADAFEGWPSDRRITISTPTMKGDKYEHTTAFSMSPDNARRLARELTKMANLIAPKPPRKKVT